MGRRERTSLILKFRTMVVDADMRKKEFEHLNAHRARAARDSQTGLREDLRILVMSATLDGARVAKLLGDAPVIESEGRAFPVETRYLGRKTDMQLERQMADAIAAALRADPGSVLAFLPGAAEIRRAQNYLGERVHDDRSKSCRCSVRSMPVCRTAPLRQRRKVTARWYWRLRSPRLR